MIQIPTDLKIYLQTLVSLTSEEKTKLLNILALYYSKNDIKREILRISEVLPNLPIEKIDGLLDFLSELLLVKYNYEEGSSTFLDQFEDSLNLLKIEFSEDLNLFFNSLFSEELKFTIAKKAIFLSMGREKLLTKSDTYTDIRPIFNLQNDLISTLTIHNLKIEYREDGLYKDIYFALDFEDLQRLKANIEQSLSKEKTIQKLFNNKNIELFKIE